MPLALQIALSIVGGDESRESVLFQFDVSAFDGQDVLA
jgi:hypothetical protein